MAIREESKVSMDNMCFTAAKYTAL